LIWRQQQINNRCKLFAVTILVFLAFGSCLFSGHYVFAQTDQTALKLQAANTAVDGAFNAVLDAEKAGANVTGLLGQLNIAEGVLAQAENSYRAGDSNTAAVQADSVLPITQEVTTSAQDAKQTALVSGQNAFWSTIALTVIGAVVFVLALFLVWRWFKRSYINDLSQAKPEVNSNETLRLPKRHNANRNFLP
jgi:CHASE3 domain sensor protein